MPITAVDPADYTGQALISLTYDDGPRNNFDIALPLHLEFNIQAGFAIIAERALEEKFRKRYMSAEQVTEASRQGIEIYSHSFTHPHLTEVSDEVLEFELKESKAALREMLSGRQKDITSICIPFSASNPHVIEKASEHYDIVRIKGNKLTSAFPGKEGRVVYSHGLSRETTFDDIKALIDKAVVEKSWLTLMLHGVVPELTPESRDNDVSQGLLRLTLNYIRDLGKETILPVNLSDVRNMDYRALKHRKP